MSGVSLVHHRPYDRLANDDHYAVCKEWLVNGWLNLSEANVASRVLKCSFTVFQ